MKIYEFLSDKSKWTKEYYARDADGSFVEANTEAAVCFCVLGAVKVLYPGKNIQWKVQEKIMAALPNTHSSIASWNDSTTHSNLLKILKKADV